MARARKLFPSYGSALAMNLLTRLERDRVVYGFVAEYVAEYDRAGILGGPLRDREFADTIGREVVLASVHEIRRRIPQFFGKSRASSLNPEELASAKAFLVELVDALGRAWRWVGEDRRHFMRDLAMYGQPTRSASARNLGKPNPRARSRAAANQRRRVSVPRQESPFVGRVALLLDPSMLEQARKAARKYLGDVEKFAQKVLRETLRPSR